MAKISPEKLAEVKERLLEQKQRLWQEVKARRIGMTAMVGGKNKTQIRNATPLPFRDVLLNIAQSTLTPKAQ